MSSREPNQQLILVQTTSDDRSLLESIANGVISERWAACAQIMGPIQSTYWWQDKLCQNNEYLLTMKSTLAHLGELRSFISQRHNYEVPEVISIAVSSCNDNYQRWWLAELRSLT